MLVGKIKDYEEKRFLKSAKFITFTYQADDKTDGVVTEGGRKVLKQGTVYPKNDATAVGLVFSDYDVTDGAVAISVLVEGEVHEEALPVVPDEAAKTALKNIGFHKDSVF